MASGENDVKKMGHMDSTLKNIMHFVLQHFPDRAPAIHWTGWTKNQAYPIWTLSDV